MKDGLRPLLLTAVLTFVLVGSIGAMIWLRTENAWLRPVPPHTVFVARMEGVTLESRDFQELTQSMAFCFIKVQGFQPNDHTYNSQRWPRPCAWYEVLGSPLEGMKVELEVPQLKKALQSELSKRGCSFPWRFALVFPDGRVVYAE